MTTTERHVQLKTAPGPQSNYFTGNLRDLQRNQLRFFLNLRREYGDVARFRILGSVYMHMIFHPEGIEHVLRRNNQNYQRGTVHERFGSLLGHGLLTSDGSFWLRQRRLAQPAFHRQRIAALAPIMTEATESMMKRWHTLAQHGQAFDVSPEMMRLTLQVVAKALFNVDAEKEAEALGPAFTVALEQINYSFSHVMLPEWVPTSRNRRYLKAVQVLDKMVYDIIESRRREEKDIGDLLSMFMLARDEETGEQMNDKQLRNEVMTMILAGHETSANALAWTWYLLSQNPDVEEKLHAELDSVLGGRVPTIADLPGLPYTKMVIDETLRLYPPAAAVSRKSVADDEIGGYHIPAGSEIAVSEYVTHRHPDFWEQPEDFDPESFTPQRSAGRPNFAYFPFGGGPHLCIGNNFALIEAQLILATVAQVYQLRMAPRHPPVIPEPLVTLRARNGILMAVQKHSRRG